MVRERDNFLGIRKRLELCSGNFPCLSNCSLSKFRKLKMTLVIETSWSPKTRSLATDRKFKLVRRGASMGKSNRDK